MPDLLAVLFQFHKELSFPVKLVLYLSLLVGLVWLFCWRFYFEGAEDIGKYERNENSPSVEMALKLARMFDISVDYLLGEGKHGAYDKDTLKRLEDIQVLDQDTRLILFNIIDTLLRDAKARKAYNNK